MLIREIREEESNLYNQVVTHPLQSWQWGEFRKKTGLDVVRLGQFDNGQIVNGLQVTFHQVPKLPLTIGYIPKSTFPDRQMLTALSDLAKIRKTIFYKLEPNIYEPATNSNLPTLTKGRKMLTSTDCVIGKPFFSKYSFILDLAQSEEDILIKMKPKTRYNIRLAIKKGVVVTEDNSEAAFEEYLRLTFEETTKRQGFYAHTKEYHKKMWQTLLPSGMAHLFKAVYEGKTLVTWILFNFNGNLYYPYGASSSENKEVMASNLMMWEAIRFGKKTNCQSFDMWGSLGPNPNPNDPWIGFHKFKEGYGSTLMEFIGTYDYVVDQPKYQVYQLVDKWRWKWLRLRTSLPF
jgi:lipid II:glycine glycyltransferase (peptidoglycan interpeptide bridge formation enzyme)